MMSGALALVRQHPATGAEVMAAITDLGELAAERSNAELAELLAHMPAVKVCLVERFAPGEIMVWVAPDLWAALHARLSAEEGQ